MKRSVPRLSGRARDVAKGELVGLPVVVAKAPDTSLIGLAGDVVGESRNTFTIRVGGVPGARRVVVSKDRHTFRFTLADGASVEVLGDAIRFRAEDRTKKVR